MTSKESLEELIVILKTNYGTKRYSDIFEEHLIKPIERDLEVLEILKQHLTIEENYYAQDNGSTKAIKLCISNCISVEEDDTYTDDCYPNPEYDKLEAWLNDK